MRRLLHLLAATGLVCALVSGCGQESAPSSPPTNSPSTTARPEDKSEGIHVFQANDVGRSGEAAGFDVCTANKEPTAKVPFQFDQTSDMQIYASTASTLADENARYWQVIIPHADGFGPTINWVYGIPMPPGRDGEKFYVYVVSLDGRTATGQKLQPGEVELTLTSEMCKTSTLPNALRPPSTTNEWLSRVLFWLGILAMISALVALCRHIRKHGR